MATAPRPVGTEPEQRSFDVVLARRVDEPVWWAPLAGPIEGAIASIPTHRETASGRRNASQIRLVLLSSGVLIVVLWQSPWAPLALLLCLSALVVPMGETRRRSLRAKLRASRKKSTIDRQSAVLTTDDRHVTLTRGEERLRRIRRGAMEVSRDGELVCVRGGGKKRDRFVVVAEGHAPPEDDLWVETADVADIEAALR